MVVSDDDDDIYLVCAATTLHYVDNYSVQLYQGGSMTILYGANF
jgi:hypothetical protein